MRWHYEKLQREHGQLARALARVREQRDQLRKEHGKLEGVLVRRDVYISEQAQLMADIRARSTQLMIERDEAKAVPLNGAGDIAEYQQTRQFLQEGRAAYKQLRAQYDELVATLDGAARERESLKEVVRSWDGLCQRLHKETNGRPRNTKDQATLSLWRDFRAHMKRQADSVGSEAK